MKLYKYSGAGNDFVVIDGRVADVDEFRSAQTIRALCSRSSGIKAADGRTGADGLMILKESAGCDFAMEYYNSDGSGGMMCGNGGRCMVAFAHELGIVPGGAGVAGAAVADAGAGCAGACGVAGAAVADAGTGCAGACGVAGGAALAEGAECAGTGAAAESARAYLFEAPDGLHSAQVLAVDGAVKTVKLKMIDVHECRRALDGWFLDTGTRHHVVFVPDVEELDVDAEGRRLRWDPAFAPQGANVNFVSRGEDARSLKIRTFEKGVEAETLACGTGITAAAIAVAAQEQAGLEAAGVIGDAAAGSVAAGSAAVCAATGSAAGSAAAQEHAGAAAPSCCHFDIQARIDLLSVDFRFDAASSPLASEVYLTGPAELIGISSI